MTSKETIDAETFTEAADLIEILLGMTADYSGHCIYVQSADGAVYSRATLQRETLSDGSHVFNVILSEA